MLFCWGRGADGRLGHDDGGADHDAPHACAALGSVALRAVALGNCHGAALAADGTSLYTFGAGSFGELGHGDLADSPAPRRMGGLGAGRIVDCSCGFYHSACVSDDGRVWTWGWGKDGQDAPGPPFVRSKTVATSGGNRLKE